MKPQVQIAPFKEHIIVNIVNSEANEYDITNIENNSATDFIKDGKFNLHQYCSCLLSKLLALNKSQIKPFIQYQCEQLSDPFVWLNKFEKLIDLNREYFTSKEQNIKIEKALVVMELIRQEIESNKFSGISKYNFIKLKQKIKTYPTTEEKLSCLLEAKTEYLQNKPRIVDPLEVPFDEKCELEINLLKTQRKLSKNKPEDKTESPLRRSPAKSKFQINSNLNLFVDIFFQLMHEKQINGKPYLEASPNELAEMISETFRDKDGKEISVSTVKTILKPSRFEKRPKGNARLNLL